MDLFWFLCLVIVVSIIFILGIFGDDFERLRKKWQEENKRQKGQVERKDITPKFEYQAEKILAGQKGRPEEFREISIFEDISLVSVKKILKSLTWNEGDKCTNSIFLKKGGRCMLLYTYTRYACYDPGIEIQEACMNADFLKISWRSYREQSYCYHQGKHTYKGTSRVYYDDGPVRVQCPLFRVQQEAFAYDTERLLTSGFYTALRQEDTWPPLQRCKPCKTLWEKE